MKPIATRYKSYFFRSRLEARYAVMFDILGIRWDYEPEGYELDGGVRYLPDFMLPEIGIWVEIKGQDPTPVELGKMVALCTGLDQDGLLISGPPGVEKVSFISRKGELVKTTITDYFRVKPIIYRAAMEAARSSRFEYGQSGAPEGVWVAAHG